MNAREAMGHAIGGGKLTRLGWPMGYFVHFDNTGKLVDSSGYVYGFPINYKWEIYHEPPKEYTFLELFDVLKGDEYAHQIGVGTYVFIKSAASLQQVSLDHGFCTFTYDNQFEKSQFTGKYIIKKKPSPPVKEKEGCTCLGVPRCNYCISQDGF